MHTGTALLIVVATLASSGCTGFAPTQPAPRLRSASTQVNAVDRRAVLAAGITGITSTFFADNAFASDEKVLVLGGTGMVGSEVVRQLQSMGVDVVSTSTNGREGTVALDFTQDDLASKVESLAKGCTAVISCVGVIGTENDAKINAGTGVAAKAAKAAGAKHFSYISVAPEVREFGRGFDFLESYMEGKAFSETAIASAFGSGAYTIIEPTFIYGGKVDANGLSRILCAPHVDSTPTFLSR